MSNNTIATDPMDAPERNVWSYLRIGLSWGLVTLVAGLGALTLVVPAVAGATPMAVLTPSMEPTLPVGTLVIVKPAAVNDIRLGDVITYQIKPGNAAVVTHRVIEVRSISTGETEFITKGDNNQAPDPTPVTAAQIKGKIWYSIPLVGYVSMAVNGSLGPLLAPLVGVGLLGYAGYILFSGALARARPRRTRNASTARDAPTENSPPVPETASDPGA